MLIRDSPPREPKGVTHAPNASHVVVGTSFKSSWSSQLSSEIYYIYIYNYLVIYYSQSFPVLFFVYLYIYLYFFFFFVNNIFKVGCGGVVRLVYGLLGQFLILHHNHWYIHQNSLKLTRISSTFSMFRLTFLYVH